MQKTVAKRKCLVQLGSLVMGLALLCGATGTGTPKRASDTHNPARQPLVQQQTIQGVQAMLEVERQSIGIADRLRMSLTVEAPVAMEVVLPKAQQALGPFAVVSQTPVGPTVITPQMRRWKQDYVLEPWHAGILTLPALSVDVKAARATPEVTGTPKHFTLSTQPVTIDVTTVLPTDADVKAPQDIAPPIMLARRGWPRWLWMGGLTLAICSLIAAMVYWHRQRRATPRIQPQPAHRVALAALQRLHEQNLIGTRQIDVFYMQVSAIVRRYIEWRFGQRAPEQTTEEFLAVVLQSGGLLATHQELLNRFLQHCDLVKFARHEPTSEDMQRTFDSARTFVEQTADDDALAPTATVGVEA